jgi:hypothetical protein
MVTNNCINAGTTSEGAMYQGKGASAPDFTVATYPKTLGAGRILYSNAANTVVGMPTNIDYRVCVSDEGSDIDLLRSFKPASWTPVLNFGGATTGITYTTQSGHYMRIHNMTMIMFEIVLSSKGTATGDAVITGFPISFGGNGYLMKGALGANNLTLDANYTQAFAQGSNNGTNISIRQMGSGQTQILCDDTNFSNTSSLVLTMMMTNQ